MTDALQKLGIDLPIFQAPIGSASSPMLAGAVSKAGGLGMLAGSWRSPDELREAIRQIRTNTPRPFAVNLGVHLAPAEKIDLCLQEGAPFISLFWGDGREYFEHIQRSGAKVIATVGSGAEAGNAADAEADIIIAQGWEAGGHVWGQIPTNTLLPQIIEAAPNVPIVAAGGIGDGCGLAAVVALGASGACLGTRFLVASESLAHPQYQACVIAAGAEDTFYGTLFDVGWPNAPHRVLRNSTVREFEQTATRTQAGEIVAWAPDGTPIPRYSSRLPTRGATGNIESMALYAGPSVQFCSRIQPAAQIVRELIGEAARSGLR